MININIICVGKLKEDYLKNAISEYSKRLSKYSNLNIIELQDEKLPNKINDTIKEEIKKKEGEKIISQIKKDSYTMVLDLKGKEMTSEEFSKKIDNIGVNGFSTINFIIGGTLGLSNEVLEKANELVSFSKMTFPHQLFRVILMEQIYRAFKINNNEEYHK